MYGSAYYPEEWWTQEPDPRDEPSLTLEEIPSMPLEQEELYYDRSRC